METFLIVFVILFILAQAENSIKKRLPEKYRNLNASKKEAAP